MGWELLGLMVVSSPIGHFGTWVAAKHLTWKPPPFSDDSVVTLRVGASAYGNVLLDFNQLAFI